MRARILSIGAIAWLVGGCTIASDFGRYYARDGAPDDATIDAARVDAGSDGGRTCECPAGETCSSGACMCGANASCGGDRSCCDGSCVSLDTIIHCGACGIGCAPRDNSQVRCNAGECEYECRLGSADCNEQTSDGCEASLVSRMHCGGCNVACAATELCAVGAGGARCVSECPTGEVECNGACANTATSEEHCGGCGQACAPIQNQTATCMNSQCMRACEPNFGDCDQRADNGCETLLVAYYEDLDGDGFGRATGSVVYGCPGAAMVGRSPNSVDCDDNAVTTYPNALEQCDGRNQDCDSQIDENAAGVGGSCACTPGAATGAYACPTAATSLVCEYPREICNGYDDDCDTTIDDGFECAAGQTRPCSMAIGACTATGTEVCDSANCRYSGQCVIAESCDRLDNDCDQLSDEDQLVAFAGQLGIGSRVAMPRADWAAGGGLRQIGVVYGTSSNGASPFDLYFARFDENGAALGGPTLITTSAESWDVAYDGNHWTLAFTWLSGGTRQLNTMRVDANTGLRGGGVGLGTGINGTAGPEMVRVDRITGGPQVAIVWIERPAVVGGVAAVRGLRLNAGPDASQQTSIGSTVDLNSSGGQRLFEFPAIVNTPGGATLAWSHFRTDNMLAEIQFATATTSGFGTPQSLASDTGNREQQLELVHDGRSDTLGLLYTKLDTANARRLTLARLTSSQNFTELTLPAAMPNGAIAAASESNFGVAYPTANGLELVRYRASDLTVVSSHAVPSGARYVQGIPAGAGRYVALGEGASMVITRVACR